MGPYFSNSPRITGGAFTPFPFIYSHVLTDHSSKAHARWETTLRIFSEGGGLHFAMVASPMIFTHAESAGRPYSSTPLNPQTLLRKVLPGSVELHNTAQCIGELETASIASSLGQGACVLGNPTFNAKGDLLFQIISQSHVPPSAIRVQAPSLASTIHRSDIGAPPKRAVGEGEKAISVLCIF